MCEGSLLVGVEAGTTLVTKDDSCGDVGMGAVGIGAVGFATGGVLTGVPSVVNGDGP